MKFRKGQVLVELLLAFVVASLSLVSMAQIATRSVSNSGYATNRSEATNYTSSGMEWVRKQRPIDGSFYTYSGLYCLNTNPISGLGGGGCGTTVIGTSIFSRDVTFTPSGSPVNQQTVTVSTKWTDRGRQFSSDQTTIFKKY